MNKTNEYLLKCFKIILFSRVAKTVLKFKKKIQEFMHT